MVVPTLLKASVSWFTLAVVQVRVWSTGGGIGEQLNGGGSDESRIVSLQARGRRSSSHQKMEVGGRSCLRGSPARARPDGSSRALYQDRSCKERRRSRVLLSRDGEQPGCPLTGRTAVLIRVNPCGLLTANSLTPPCAKRLPKA